MIRIDLLKLNKRMNSKIMKKNSKELLKKYKIKSKSISRGGLCRRQEIIKRKPVDKGFSLRQIKIETKRKSKITMILRK